MWKKKGKKDQPSNMRLCSKRRALAWSQVRLADTGGGKRRMTSVFPSCRISHDISCTEEHFTASHKHLSPVLSLSPPSDALPLHPSLFRQPNSAVESQATWRYVVALVAPGYGCYEWAPWQRRFPSLRFHRALKYYACFLTGMSWDNFHDYGWEWS